MAQFQFEDGFGLIGRQPETGHQLGLGLVFSTDDFDHFINIEIGDQQTFQDMQASKNLVEAML